MVLARGNKVAAESRGDTRDLRARDIRDGGTSRQSREDLGRVGVDPGYDLGGVAAVGRGDGRRHGDVAGVGRGREVLQLRRRGREGAVDGEEGLDAGGDAVGLAGLDGALDVLVGWVELCVGEGRRGDEEDGLGVHFWGCVVFFGEVGGWLG